MNLGNYKTFNLDQRRPKVLLVGNGLTYESGIPWHELIRQTARKGADITQYERENPDGTREFAVPNTVLMMAISETGDRQRHKRYVEALNKKTYPDNARIKELLALPFDAVLTTNYTYDLEAALLPRYPGLSDTTKRRYACVTADKQDQKFLLHTFNKMGDGTPDIWHIHGELRRPSSLVLSHDEYARLVHEILDYNKRTRNRYAKERESMRCRSWIDYLILGDVYILGLGMDFAEFDLWWLLGRRMREITDCGHIIFYEPEKDGNIYKQRALQSADVEVRTCGVAIQHGGDYEKFYGRAIEDIRAMTAS